MNTKNQYVAPELTLVGEARDVVLGMDYIGGDMFGDRDIPEMEFASD